MLGTSSTWCAQPPREETAVQTVTKPGTKVALSSENQARLLALARGAGPGRVPADPGPGRGVIFPFVHSPCKHLLPGPSVQPTLAWHFHPLDDLRCDLPVFPQGVLVGEEEGSRDWGRQASQRGPF